MHTTGSPAASQWPRPLCASCLRLAALYLLAALLSLYVSRQAGSVASIWYANAVAVSFLVFHPWRRAPALLLAMALANLTANAMWGDAWLTSLRFLPGNVLEVLLGAWLVRRAQLHTLGVSTPIRMAQLLLRGGLAPQLLGATWGTLLLSSTMNQEPMAVWLAWFEGSVIGAMSMLPLAFMLQQQPWSLHRVWLQSPQHGGLLLVALGTTLLAMVYLPSPFVYVTIPLLLAAVVLPPQATALITLLVSLTMAILLAIGLFVPPPVTHAWEQTFIYLAYAAALIPAHILSAAMAEVRASHRQLAQTAHELAVANEGLEQFVRIASHDLREPLNTVVQFSGLVEEDHGQQLPPPARRYLHLVRTAAERMRTLLDDVLSYTRARHAPLESPGPVPLDHTFGELRHTLAARLERRGVRLEVGPLPVVAGDPSLLSLLFQNLLTNALKFVPAQRSPHVVVSARTEAGFALVTVADNGIGMAPEDLGRLFQPFSRLRLRREFEGTGLGLALCRQIAQAHGGEVSVSSVPDEGSQFTVRLPLFTPP